MYERTALPDGPRVITSRLAGARSVSLAAYVLAGSRLESAEDAGAAHFMEHITFKGTAAYPGMRACGSKPPGRPSTYFMVASGTPPCLDPMAPTTLARTPGSGRKPRSGCGATSDCLRGQGAE